MPKIRRQNIPPALLQHLLDRIQQRRISADQLGCWPRGLIHNPMCQKVSGSSDYREWFYVAKVNWSEPFSSRARFHQERKLRDRLSVIGNAGLAFELSPIQRPREFLRALPTTEYRV